MYLFNYYNFFLAIQVQMNEEYYVTIQQDQSLTYDITVTAW